MPMYDASAGAGGRSPAQDRVMLAWRRRALLSAVALLCGGLVGLVLQLTPTSYRATASVQVTLLQTVGAGQSTALAANALAAQYAQLATTASVLDTARSMLEQRDHDLVVEARPLNSYNVVTITATGADEAGVARQANAVAEALITEIAAARTRGLARATASDAGRLKALDEQIDELRALIRQRRTVIAESAGSAAANTAAAALNSEQSLLANLLAQREGNFTAEARRLVVAQPDVAVLDRPSAGVPQDKKTVPFSLLGALVGALVLVEILVVAARLRAVPVVPASPAAFERDSLPARV